jgi:hypothetical protein
MDQDAASSGSGPAIKVSDRFPHLANDLVGRVADKINAQTAKVMLFSKFVFSQIR